MNKIISLYLNIFLYLAVLHTLPVSNSAAPLTDIARQVGRAY